MENLRALAANFSDIRVLLLYYLVESSFLAYTGLRLLGVRINFKQVISVGIIHASAVFIVRGLYTIFGLTFGTHTLILLFVMALLLNKIGRVRWGVAFTAALIGMMLITLGDMVTMPFFYQIIKIPVEEVWANPWTHILAGYVSDSILILMALAATFTNLTLLNLRD